MINEGIILFDGPLKKRFLLRVSRRRLKSQERSSMYTYHHLVFFSLFLLD